MSSISRNKPDRFRINPRQAASQRRRLSQKCFSTQITQIERINTDYNRLSSIDDWNTKLFICENPSHLCHLRAFETASTSGNNRLSSIDDWNTKLFICENPSHLCHLRAFEFVLPKFIYPSIKTDIFK
jgi:hypothetical protein